MCREAGQCDFRPIQATSQGIILPKNGWQCVKLQKHAGQQIGRPRNRNRYRQEVENGKRSTPTDSSALPARGDSSEACLVEREQHQHEPVGAVIEARHSAVGLVKALSTTAGLACLMREIRCLQWPLWARRWGGPSSSYPCWQAKRDVSHIPRSPCTGSLAAIQGEANLNFPRSFEQDLLFRQERTLWENGKLGRVYRPTS
jgi:hypothetical protein